MAGHTPAHVNTSPLVRLYVPQAVAGDEAAQLRASATRSACTASRSHGSRLPAGWSSGRPSSRRSAPYTAIGRSGFMLLPAASP
jgi:hypothetical protein